MHGKYARFETHHSSEFQITSLAPLLSVFCTLSVTPSTSPSECTRSLSGFPLAADPSRGLTYRGHDEHNQEGVEHGHHRSRDRRHDVAQRAHAAEEADDAEGAQRAERVDGHRDGAQRDERERHHGGVKDVPAVRREGPEPVRVGVDGQLGGEDDGEEGVDALEALTDGSGCAVAVDEGFHELGLRGVGQKILVKLAQSARSYRPGVNEG